MLRLPVRAPQSEGPFYGWRVVAAGVVAQTLGIGLLGAYGFFVTPLAAEFGTSMAGLGVGMSIFALTGALLAPVLGRLLDRGRVRALMLAGVAAMLTGMLASSRAESLAQFGGALVVVFAGMILFGPLPVQVLIINWFSAQRGRALAIAALGLNVPGFFVPPLTAWLIDGFGWRGALLALGIGSAALVAPVLAIWVVTRPEDLGQHPDGNAEDAAVRAGPGSEAHPPTSRFLTDRDFWIIAVGLGLLLAAPMLNGVYLVRHMEQAGISRQSAAFVVSWIAAFGALGKLMVAALADRMDKRWLVWGLVVVQLGSWALILAPPDFGTMLVAGVGLGLGIGGFVPLPALFVGTWFGRAAFGQAAGLMSPIRLPITLAIVPVGGWLADRSGTHAATFLAAMSVAAVGAFLLLFLRPPGHRPPG